MRPPLTPKTFIEFQRCVGVLSRHQGRRWFYFKNNNFTIMVPTKSGSSSIREFIWMNELENHIVAIKQHQVVGTIYVVIRDPISRFCSLWRSKCWEEIEDKNSQGWSLDELMTHIEDGAKNIHWTSQSKMIGNLDPILIPLENLNEWWSINVFGKLGKFNTTDGETEINNELAQRILTFYADDLKLYHAAQLAWSTAR